MATTGDAPLSLIKPEVTDLVSLGVINQNYDTINDFAVTVVDGSAINNIDGGTA